MVQGRGAPQVQLLVEYDSFQGLLVFDLTFFDRTSLALLGGLVTTVCMTNFHWLSVARLPKEVATPTYWGLELPMGVVTPTYWGLEFLLMFT